MAVNPPSEADHDVVYGKTFALYDKKQLQEFLQPFIDRFAANRLDAAAAFTGKACLDAGCGGGRGAIFMLLNGARSVVGFDYSPTNVETARRNAALYGFDITTQQGTLAKLPFADETFDFVWCNGVLQHAADPDACLREITRVLKTGGQAWIYVYGSGGIYWYSVYRFRELLKGVSTEACTAALRLMRYETRYVAEYIDDWKVSFLRAYSAADMNRRLAELGYERPAPLKYGVSYDTSHRINTNAEDARWLGEGDLRYLVTKRGARAEGNHPISSSEYGSDVEYAPAIVERMGPLFDELARVVAGDETLAIAAAANIQRELRDQLSLSGAFDVDRYVASVVAATDLARQSR
ncbi:MAG: methyltransferase protein [bacterium]|nr:methyltransferase protein [bacterium]